MSDLIPLIALQEQTRIKVGVSEKFVAVTFDGTTRLGEAMAILLWYVDSDW